MRKVAAVLLMLLGGCEKIDVPFAKVPKATAKVDELVRWGDRLYTRAMRHLTNSDPTANPDGWAQENKEALRLFQQANQEGYIPAQDEYGRVPVPPELLDRVRETMMRTALCRKRAVSARR